MMYATFQGKRATLYTETKQFVRQFNVPSEIVNVQVQGVGNDAVVAIAMKNGRTILYSATGRLIRS